MKKFGKRVIPILLAASMIISSAPLEDLALNAIAEDYQTAVDSNFKDKTRYIITHWHADGTADVVDGTDCVLDIGGTFQVKPQTNYANEKFVGYSVSAGAEAVTDLMSSDPETQPCCQINYNGGGTSSQDKYVL